MQRSLQLWKGEPIEVEYRAFFLNADIPPEGYDFASYMQAKFNGRMTLQQAFEGPKRMGAAVGLVFNMDKITRAPNTARSHALIALAPSEVREALIEALYDAYFEHGQDIGDLQTLVALGTRFGLPADELERQLAAGDVYARIEAEVQHAYSLGIHAVPFFVINDKYGFSGAVQPEVILNILNDVVEREKQG